MINLWIGYHSQCSHITFNMSNDNSHILVNSPQDLEGWNQEITIRICFPGLRCLSREGRKSYHRLVWYLGERCTVKRYKKV